MKLKNKKTGVIGNLVLNINPNRESYTVLSTENGDTVCGNLVLADYDNLAELNEEWEDYEALKRCWIIDTMNDCVEDYDIPLDAPFNKEIGNYFETEEAAELAIRKLKAWKRLKDKGFEFCKYSALAFGEIDFRIPDFEGWDDNDEKQVKEDLDLLFGGNE